MAGTYDLFLVSVSIAIAILASYAALDIAGRVRVHHGTSRWFWTTGGASAMGLGIWAMHYVGMLAFRLPVAVMYHLPTVLGSLLTAVAASLAALITVGRRQFATARFLVGSLIMGLGISAMHYVGMEAMRLPATMHYRAGIVVLSILLAIVIAGIALFLSNRPLNHNKASLQKFASAALMGVAIAVMHYTGMRAAVFSASSAGFDSKHALRISSLGIAVISGSTFLVLALVVAAAFLDRLLAAEKAIGNAIRDGEMNFRSLTETIPQIIWIAHPDATIEFFNQRWYEYTGMTFAQSQGLGWESIVHVDDLAVCREKWRAAQFTNADYQGEYRLRRADGGYRWHLVRALALRDKKKHVVKWLGSCTDIDDQKKTEQALEQQVAQRTSALREANLKLTEEMRQREYAQQELNKQTEVLVRSLTERTRKNALLSKMGELLQNCAHQSEALPVLASFAPKLFPDLRGALLLINPDYKVLEVAIRWLGCQLEDTIFPFDSCWALRTGRRHQPGQPGSIACPHAAAVKFPYLCLPVRAQGEVAGVMHFQLTGEDELAETDIVVLESFAEQVGLSLANIRLREELRAQSIRDPLSGLFNRRYLEETLHRELVRATRCKLDLGIMMLDLDHFRVFNDTFGHDAGDAILREVGHLLSHNPRSEDIPCRFGGEKFVLVLPGAGLETMRERAEQLRSGIMGIELPSGSDPSGRITASLGVAAFPYHGSTPQSLLDAALAALNKAKKNGPNQVAVAEISPITDISLVSR